MSDLDLLRQARDELRLWLLQLHGFKPRNATEDSDRLQPLILALDMRLRPGHSSSCTLKTDGGACDCGVGEQDEPRKWAECLALIGVFEEDGMWQSMPTLACVDPQTLPTLVKVLRTMADNIEAGDRGASFRIRVVEVPEPFHVHPRSVVGTYEQELPSIAADRWTARVEFDPHPTHFAGAGATVRFLGAAAPTPAVGDTFTLWVDHKVFFKGVVT